MLGFFFFCIFVVSLDIVIFIVEESPITVMAHLFDCGRSKRNANYGKKLCVPPQFYLKISNLNSGKERRVEKQKIVSFNLF